MKRWGKALRALLCAATLSAGPALAAPKDLHVTPAPGNDLAELRTALAGLQTDDTRLLSIGWKLASANAAYCADAQPSVGLLPLDARTFRKPEEIREALGIGGEFAVQAVASGSPAALAEFHPGEELLAIGSEPFSSLPDVPAGSFQRLAALQSRIEAVLAEKGELDVEVQAPGATPRRVTLHGVAACRSRYELLTDGNEAAADGERIIISRRFLALARSDDEAAFFVGHELAHNILRHRALLNKIGRSNSNTRQTERAADRLALWLMTNAGFDTARATDFMARWGPQQANLLFHDPTHDHWKARHALMVAERARITAAKAAHPDAPLDWRTVFPR